MWQVPNESMPLWAKCFTVFECLGTSMDMKHKFFKTLLNHAPTIVSVCQLIKQHSLVLGGQETAAGQLLLLLKSKHKDHVTHISLVYICTVTVKSSLWPWFLGKVFSSTRMALLHYWEVCSRRAQDWYLLCLWVIG